ncbi:hypothetical protein GPECTOR_8g388 [Gonium pectorale]|uniref:Uncharacterized protein n=1 Tax=Gonium pectorale TaxID=33097 RepID=A0A150GUL9_GONPE|nr:hypothetical protein GPECTOR_8g388 [Gonium pectorale]|eukprot:KXZ53020.1 hypothetical protein GPECTOR_8g388 [Gonium pectorale]
MRLVQELQVALLRLTGGAGDTVLRSGMAQPAAMAAAPPVASRASPAATAAASTSQASAAPAARKGPTERAPAQVVMVAAPSAVPAVESSQRSVPVAALAITAAAALLAAGYWLLQRWRVTVKAQRESEARMAVNRNSLVRQKQASQGQR